MQLPEQIESERIVLKHPMKPTFKLAEELYAIVDKSRNTLREWLPWVDKTNSVEDEFTGYLVSLNQKHWDEGNGFGYLIYQKETNQILGVVDLCHVEENINPPKSGIGSLMTQQVMGICKRLYVHWKVRPFKMDLTVLSSETIL